jgi:hypothetical protein
MFRTKKGDEFEAIFSLQEVYVALEGAIDTCVICDQPEPRTGKFRQSIVQNYI